jgi:hypothetical protein
MTRKESLIARNGELVKPRWVSNIDADMKSSADAPPSPELPDISLILGVLFVWRTGEAIDVPTWYGMAAAGKNPGLRCCPVR